MKQVAISFLAVLTKIRFRIHGPCRLIIGRGCKIVHRKKILTYGSRGELIKVANNCVLNAHSKGKILIGGGSMIGQRTSIFANNLVKIGKNVLIAPDVFITDHNHQYRDPSTPICFQGQAEIDNEIVIGDGAWIGTKVTILGNVSIGKNSVIGANSVVTKSIPDYCVAVGAPARVVKRYDAMSGEWIKCSER